MVYGDVRSIDGSGATINIMRFANWELDDLMCFKFISQPGTFMRRSVLQQAGYIDASYHYLLDHVLWLRMAQIAPIQYVPKLWATARFHAAAKNLSGGERYGQDAYRIVDWMQSDPAFAERFQRLRPAYLGWRPPDQCPLPAGWRADAPVAGGVLEKPGNLSAGSAAGMAPDYLCHVIAVGCEGLRERYLDWRRKRYEHWS